MNDLPPDRNTQQCNPLKLSYQSDTKPATMTLFVCATVRQHCLCSFGFLQDQGQIGITYPAYLTLYESGELARCAEQARQRLAACTLCAQACGTNRVENETGNCGVGRYALVASARPISQELHGAVVSSNALANIFLALQRQGCHNLSLVHVPEKRPAYFWYHMHHGGTTIHEERLMMAGRHQQAIPIAAADVKDG